MTDYISREALKEALENADADVCESYPDGHCDWGFGRKNINDVIDGVPATDVEQTRRWIPCSERMPGENVPVLGWYKDNPFASYCPEIVSWNGKGWVFVYAQRYVTDVTHWQPLPQPPKK